MKLIAKLAIGGALFAVSVVPTAAEPTTAENVCLHTYYIDGTHVVNAKTILFQMKDGSTWRNTLPASCEGLLLHGFTYNLHYEEICSNDNLPITIVETQEVC